MVTILDHKMPFKPNNAARAGVKYTSSSTSTSTSIFIFHFTSTSTSKSTMIFYLSSTSTNTSTLSQVQVQVQIHCVINQNTQINIQSYVPGGGGGTPYDDQCTMLGGLGSIFELGSIP